MSNGTDQIDNYPGPAFPVIPPLDPSTGGSASQYPFADQGMSLRDYFAAKALPAIMSAMQVDKVLSKAVNFQELAAQTAYGIADAMLAERAKK